MYLSFQISSTLLLRFTITTRDDNEYDLSSKKMSRIHVL